MLEVGRASARTAILAELQGLLGEERFEQLSQEGQALTFMQMLEIVLEFLGSDS